MPRLIKLYIQQVLIGFGLSAVFTALLLWFNVANLWHLVVHTSGGVLAVFLLWLFSGIVFAGVQFGIRIMSMRDDDDDEPRGGKRQYLMPEPIAVRAQVAAKPRRKL